MVASPPDDDLPRRREPWLYGAIGGLVILVLVLAIALILALGGTNQEPVAATSSPGASVEASQAASAAPSDSPAPTEGQTATTSPEPSAEPTAEPTPTNPPPTQQPSPTPATNPAIITYSAPKVEDCTDDTAGTIHLTWSIIRATGVTISVDGPGIYDSYPGTSGSVDIPFGCSTEVDHHTYTLRTTGGSGPAATATKTVNVGKPKILSFDLPAMAACGATPSVPIDFGYEIQYATGTSLARDELVQGTYPGKTSSPGLTAMFDCTKESQTFVLTTTGGYGPAATAELVVTRAMVGP